MTNKTQTIRPVSSVNGSLRLPGDKSISHRYAMLAALAEGTSRFENFSSAADCASTLGCMEALGARIARIEHEGRAVIEVEGRGGELRESAHPLDCGNSGSTMRMLAGIVAGREFESTLIGDESLSRRPMRRVMEPLAQMGANIDASDGGRPPLRVHGRRLHAIDYEMPVASAQVKSCVLLAGLSAEGETIVREKIATRDHTEIALAAFGATVRRERQKVSVRAGEKLRAIEAYVPGDVSTATFFLCAAALFPGSNVIFDSMLLNPTRTAMLDVLATMGMNIGFLKVETQHGELIGTVRVQGGRLRGFSVSGAMTAALIDELPALAAIAPLTEEGIEIRDAAELRVKESDRLAAVAENLRRMGAQFEEHPDGMKIPGGQQLHGAELESFGDHRIAMAFSIAALRAQGESTMHGADAVAVSYPEFFESLAQLTET